MSFVRRVADGYTVVEAMIFLAVSGALFAATVIAFAGQNGRTRFATAAREMEVRTQDLINDISTGVYTKSDDFTCRRIGTGLTAQPQITAAAAEQGTNEECIFIGRVMHLNVGGVAPVGSGYNTYTVVGLREYEVGGSRQESQSFSEARPRSHDRLTIRGTLPGGMTVSRIEYSNGGGTFQSIDGFGVFSSFGSHDPGTNQLEPGSLTVNLVPLGNSGATTQAGMIGLIAGIPDPPANNQNPVDGVKICLVSGSSDQHAVLSIGGNDRRLATDLVIGNGSCPANMWT